MMAKFNKEYVVVYNTFQLYRRDKLQYLKDSHQRALDGGYILGAKLVRGAYMEKERARADEMNYPSPINPSKEATDEMYDKAVSYCVKNHESIASCVASHNEKSIRLQAEMMNEMGIDKNHPHLNFCQLYGMSDHFSFNLADLGFNAAKYVPYGSIKDVVPYLIRRAQENSSVSGEMGRELKIIKKEIQRRGL
jgi:proline dehydrogenase